MFTKLTDATQVLKTLLELVMENHLCIHVEGADVAASLYLGIYIDIYVHMYIHTHTYAHI